MRLDGVSGIFSNLISKATATDAKEINSRSKPDQISGENNYQNPSKKDNNEFTQDIEPGTELPIHGKLEDSRKSYRINFCELQRMHLRQLQYKLVDHVVNLTYSARPVSGWSYDA